MCQNSLLRLVRITFDQRIQDSQMFMVVLCRPFSIESDIEVVAEPYDLIEQQGINLKQSFIIHQPKYEHVNVVYIRL